MKRTRRYLVIHAGFAAAVGCGLALGQTAITEAIDGTLPDAGEIAIFHRPGTITLLSSDGQVIQKLGPETREKVSPGAMPELVKQAFVAAEDRRFYRHNGVDFWGMGRALLINLRSGSVQQGASTITQQLARIVFLNLDKTITRKLREAALAYKLERQLSKEQILEQYLNYVYLGSGAYGVADAAWVYFTKIPDQLTLPEAALIAGVTPAPSLYSPLVDASVALKRRDMVLLRMEKEGFITADALEDARSSPLNLKPATPKYFNSAAPYFTGWVLQQLPQMLTPEQLELGGLTIRTSLNLNWQQRAQQVVRKYAPGQSEGAIVSMQPSTGLVRVMVGGKNFQSSQFNRTIQALRSPGSTFKLFPYAAAIQAGVRPDDIFIDSPRCWKGYCPKNFGKKYFGPISLADAFQKSLNTVAVQLQDRVGFDAVIAMANNLSIGTTRPLGRYYPMAIGAYEQTILDMTAAYAAVANRGVYVKPTAFEEIRGPGGDLFWSRRADGPRGRRAVDRDVADTMNWMLQRVVSGGTGVAAKLGDRPVAGKTGTSEGARDLWFIGSIPQLTTAVWFGYDNNRETGSSSGEAAWAWKQYMGSIKENFPVQKFPPKPLFPKLEKKARGTNRGAPSWGDQNADPVTKPGDSTLPDTSWDISTPAIPVPSNPTVVPPGGPPVDEFFRPLPVQ
ncbi:MAG: transglycosylase domain-containing protein [Synechococcus sp.]